MKKMQTNSLAASPTASAKLFPVQAVRFKATHITSENLIFVIVYSSLYVICRTI